MVVARPEFRDGVIKFWLISGHNCLSSDEDQPDPEVPFSKDRNVMVDLFEVGIKEEVIFTIGFGIPDDAEADLEHMSSFDDSAEECARITKRQEEKRLRNLQNNGTIGSYFICGREVPAHTGASIISLEELLEHTENKGLL